MICAGGLGWRGGGRKGLRQACCAVERGDMVLLWQVSIMA
jgi:hypothetical protein